MTWEETIRMVKTIKRPLVSITGYNINQPDEVVTSIDLDHIWDIKKARFIAFDHMLQTLGLADVFKIE